jgi:hypothetical protein
MVWGWKTSSNCSCSCWPPISIGYVGRWQASPDLKISAVPLVRLDSKTRQPAEAYCTQCNVPNTEMGLAAILRRAFQFNPSGGVVARLLPATHVPVNSRPSQVPGNEGIEE